MAKDTRKNPFADDEEGDGRLDNLDSPTEKGEGGEDKEKPRRKQPEKTKLFVTPNDLEDEDGGSEETVTRKKKAVRKDDTLINITGIWRHYGVSILLAIAILVTLLLSIWARWFLWLVGVEILALVVSLTISSEKVSAFYHTTTRWLGHACFWLLAISVLFGCFGWMVGVKPSLPTGQPTGKDAVELKKAHAELKADLAKAQAELETMGKAKAKADADLAATKTELAKVKATVGKDNPLLQKQIDELTKSEATAKAKVTELEGEVEKLKKGSFTPKFEAKAKELEGKWTGKYNIFGTVGDATWTLETPVKAGDVYKVKGTYAHAKAGGLPATNGSIDGVFDPISGRFTFNVVEVLPQKNRRGFGALDLNTDATTLEGQYIGNAGYKLEKAK